MLGSTSSSICQCLYDQTREWGHQTQQNQASLLQKVQTAIRQNGLAPPPKSHQRRSHWWSHQVSENKYREEKLYKMMLLHKQNLIKRGYPRNLINKTLRRIKFSMRSKVMDPNYCTLVNLKPKDHRTTVNQDQVWQSSWQSFQTDQQTLEQPIQKANIRNKKLASFVNKFKPRLTYKSTGQTSGQGKAEEWFVTTDQLTQQWPGYDTRTNSHC